jgi:hypothetical protein
LAKIITFTINEDATVTGDAEGFQGRGCAEALSKMMEALGGEQVSAGHKPEYHQNVATQIKVGG